MALKKIILLLALTLIFKPLFSQESNSDFQNYKLLHHSSAIRDIVFSTDGKLMASVSDSTIIIWQLSVVEGKPPAEKSRFNDKATVNSVCFAENNKSLVTGGFSQEVKIWNLGKGKVEKIFKIRYSQEEVDKMSISEKREVERNQWTSSRNSYEKTEKGSFPSIINKVVYFKSKIFSAQCDNTVKSWDINSSYGKMENLGRSSDWHKWNVNDICISKDGRYVYTASDDNTIKKWSISGLNLQREKFEGHRRSVTGIASSPQSKFLISVSKDNSMRVWNESGSEICGVIGKGNRINDIDFADNGKYIATAEEDDLCIWSISEKTGKLSLIGRIDAHDGREITKVAFLPSINGRIEVLSGCVNGEIKCWDVQVLIVRKYFSAEYAKRKKETDLFRPQGEFERTLDYLNRKQKANDFEKTLDREFLAKYKEIGTKIDQDLDPKVVEKKIWLKIDHLSSYNPDEEIFMVRIKGIERKVNIPIKEAPNFKKYYKQAKVSAVEVTNDGKTQIKNIKIIDYKTKKVYEFGDLDD